MRIYQTQQKEDGSPSVPCSLKKKKKKGFKSYSYVQKKNALVVVYAY